MENCKKINQHLIKYLIFLFPFFYCVQLFSQDTTNLNYFNQLKLALAKDTDVIKSKFVQEKYFNGRIKSQSFYVKLKSDSKKRYWRIGKIFTYHKNGKLKSIDNIDLKTKIMIDTSYVYNSSGEVICKTSLKEGSNQKSPVKIINPLKYLFYNYWEYLPNKFRIILYNKGKKVSEIPFEDFESTGSVKHGDVIYYKEDGSIDRIEKYEKGVLVK